jgi:hypothetical protein
MSNIHISRLLVGFMENIVATEKGYKDSRLVIVTGASVNSSINSSNVKLSSGKS